MTGVMHQAEQIMRAHLIDKQSTIASIGVCYALAIAARPMFGPDDWERLHGAIRERFQPADDKAWMRTLDQIKQRGWRLCGAMVEAERNAEMQP